MSRSPEGPDPDLLFDLPLEPSAADGADEATAEVAAAGDAGDGKGGRQVALTFHPEDAGDAAPPATVEAPLSLRFTAAALDLVAMIAVLGFALLALRLLEVPIGTNTLAPLGLFLASFSFLYQVMPLAFWGHTPGMAYAGIHSRARGGDFMTIQQCVLRWLGWLLAAATGGLAALVALSGVSLSDLLSRTRTYRRSP